jgi:hypothetical protein
MLGLVGVSVGMVLMAPVLRSQAAAPTARAARLSSVEGQVRIAQGGQVLADPALTNTPLFEGTQLLTSDDGRAELQLDDGSVLRISPNTSLTLAVLHGQGETADTEIILASGLAYFELQGQSTTKPIRVRFGDSVVTTDGAAVLRINLDNPPGELAVFSGNAHLERGTSLSLDLHGGESVALNGADPTQSIVAESIEPDSWDTWNADRDQAMTATAAARTGAENSLPDNENPAWNDLDANGSWYNVPGQGSVWSPYEAADSGWDPYGNGYWMWTPRFGYIWVSGDSWGYLPFQFGAWNYYSGFGWGWAPGAGQPWWGNGWASNIGNRPFGYRPPIRPTPPHGPVFHPMRAGLTASPNAVVAVNRHLVSGRESLPVRDRNVPVTIAGHVVQLLHPVSPRPQYDRSAAGAQNGSRPAYGGTRPQAGQRPANSFASGGSHPVYAPGNSAAPRFSVPVARPSAPASRPSGGQQSPTYSRPSSGGGSSSAGHSSGGGGGGGSHR